MLPEIKKQIIDSIHAALREIALSRGIESDLPLPHLERPKVAEHGDFATNIAMQLAKSWKINPRELAVNLIEVVNRQHDFSMVVAAAEIAGPGFINLRLTDSAKRKVVNTVLTQSHCFGKQSGINKKVLIEFVSANPTGPLHVGHGRQAALGDAISNLMATQGWSVHREFYYNDAGVQIANLAVSVQARAQGLEPGGEGWPEQAYNGEYIADIARDFMSKATVAAADGQPVTASGSVDDIESIRQFAVAYLRKEQDIDLQSFGVKFDCYYLESSLSSGVTTAQSIHRSCVKCTGNSGNGMRSIQVYRPVIRPPSVLALDWKLRHAHETTFRFCPNALWHRHSSRAGRFDGAGEALSTRYCRGAPVAQCERGSSHLRREARGRGDHHQRRAAQRGTASAGAAIRATREVGRARGHRSWRLRQSPSRARC